jgi:hypothetical protein
MKTIVVYQIVSYYTRIINVFNIMEWGVLLINFIKFIVQLILTYLSNISNIISKASWVDLKFLNEKYFMAFQKTTVTNSFHKFQPQSTKGTVVNYKSKNFIYHHWPSMTYCSHIKLWFLFQSNCFLLSLLKKQLNAIYLLNLYSLLLPIFFI